MEEKKSRCCGLGGGEGVDFCLEGVVGLLAIVVTIESISFNVCWL